MLIAKRIVPLFKKNDWVQLDQSLNQKEKESLAKQGIQPGSAYQVSETLITEQGCWLRLVKIASLPPPSSIATEFVSSEYFVPAST